jgi:hypothetical protein
VSALNTAETGARLSCRAIEQLICEIWSGYFGRAVTPYDDFFELGGDSLTVLDFVAEARGRGMRLRSSTALRNPSPARLAECLVLDAAEPLPLPEPLPTLYASARQAAQVRAAEWTPAQARPARIVAGDGEPVHVVHSDSHVEVEREVVAGWAGDRPVSGFTLRGVRALIPPVAPIEEIAGRLVEELRADRAVGPYRLAGFGPGAVLAFEMARQLQDSGDQIALLALIRPPVTEAGAGRDQLLRQRIAMLARRFALAGDEPMEQIHARVRADGWYDDGVRPWDLPWLQLAWADLTRAAQVYAPTGYRGPVLLVEDVADSNGPGRDWLRAVPDPEIHRLGHGLSSPLGVLRDGGLAQTIRKALAA